MLRLTAALIAYCFPVLGAGFIPANASDWDATRCPVQLQTTRLGTARRHATRRCANSSPASLRHLVLTHGPPAPKAERIRSLLLMVQYSHQFGGIHYGTDSSRERHNAYQPFYHAPSSLRLTSHVTSIMQPRMQIRSAQGAVVEHERREI
jgi:hypothetical protein